MVAIEHLSSKRFRRLRRVEYEHLAEAGFFEDEKVELLYGRLVEMSPQGRDHAYAIEALNEILVLGLQRRARVRVQLPFAALDESEPEPDLAVVAAGSSLDGHPSSALLIIEVAQTSLAEDRAKQLLYAKAGVPEYWIVNLVDSVIERYTKIAHGSYTEVSLSARGTELSLPSFDDVRVAINDLLVP